MIATIRINMDGYNSSEEEREAIKIFIEEQLDFSACSVEVIDVKVSEDEIY